MLTLDVQRDTQEPCPGEDDLRRAIELALHAVQNSNRQPQWELSLRIVDRAEMQSVNKRFRGKDTPTNVLSFPAELPPGLPDEVALPILGDLLVCAPVVKSEADSQRKALAAHWDHMLIHGVLHLLGYDHESEAEAQEMESLETRLLGELGWPCPYTELPDTGFSDAVTGKIANPTTNPTTDPVAENDARIPA
ncbi:MAG: rRNA maturation RNase YbeY [Congregibacter sp.]